MNTDIIETTVEGKTIEERRGTWTTRVAFYCVAIGSAVGFGNVWRFPALVVQYGNGAFFIPYLMALFLIGIPLLMLEIGFGQYFQTGDVNVFGGFHPRFRGVGLASIACGYMLVCYYSMLIAWVINAFFDSFTSSAPWTDEGVTGGEAIEYFLNDIIGMGTLFTTVGNETVPIDNLRPSRVVTANVGYSFMTWAIIFMCVGFGVKWTGRIAYATMGLPVVLLFVFLGKALTLPGASDGIEFYIGDWNVEVLREDGSVWSTAVSQVFFSLSVTFGIMTAYGSYCPRGEPAYLNSCVVGLSDTLFSLISGFAVFAALGHLAYLESVPIEDLSYRGFSLVFGTWPVVLGQLPGGIHWVRLLFVDLFLLGIDSAFSFIEGFSTVFLDTVYFQNTPRWKLAGSLCILGWLLSLMYATDAGLVWLDVIDFYINYTMILVGFFETFAAGWIYGISQQVEKLGWAIYLTYMASNFLPVILACGIWFGVDKDKGAVWGGFTALLGSYLVGIITTLFLMKKKMKEAPEEWTWSSIIWHVSFKNIVDLRDKIEPVIGHFPFAWCFLTKQFIPQILLILFVNLSQSPTESGQPVFGHYGDYVTQPFQVLGILTFVFAAAIFTLGFLFPKAYEPLRLPEGHLQLEDKLSDSHASGEIDSAEEALSKEQGYDAAENVNDLKKELGYDKSPDDVDVEIIE